MKWEHVKATECHGDYVEDAYTGITVCDLYLITPTGNIVHHADHEKHAALIAAAPDTAAERDSLKAANAELLEALENIENDDEHMPPSPRENPNDR